MKILFHLGHPAHFHLFKNVIKNLEINGHKISILIKKKDILEDLLNQAKLTYKNILTQGRKDSKIGLIYGQILQDYGVLKFCLKNKQDLLIGSSSSIAHVGKLLNIPSINVTEDDAEVVPLFAKIAFPWSSAIIAPEVCSVGKWKNKKIAYSGYNELAYLHPQNFIPNRKLVNKYFPTDNKYFILRLAKLTAHHDNNINGINKEIVSNLINILKTYGEIYITSERKLEEKFERYRININPLDMHHVLAFATLYIGDSQTMAAEAGVLGVPFVRFNDFVGQISYLNELEDKYKLGYGIKTNEVIKLYDIVNKLINDNNLIETFQKRREKMLKDKIEFSSFLTWFFENYPNSAQIMRESPDYQFEFIK